MGIHFYSFLIVQWKILPLVENFDDDEHFYEIHVHTGFKKNSGTKSNVFIKLTGNENETGVRILDDGQREVRFTNLSTKI